MLHLESKKSCSVDLQKQINFVIVRLSKRFMREMRRGSIICVLTLRIVWLPILSKESGIKKSKIITKPKRITKKGVRQIGSYFPRRKRPNAANSSRIFHSFGTATRLALRIKNV